MGVPFLGAVPIKMALRENSDSGDPGANFDGDAKLADALTAVANNLAGRISVQALQGAGV